MTMFHRNSVNDSTCCATKCKEKNLFSALLGILTVIFLCASLVEPVWFKLECGKCITNYGIQTVFKIADTNNEEFEENVTLTDENCGKDKKSDHRLVVEFIKSKEVALIQVIIVFCVLAICLSAFSFLLDVITLHRRLFLKLVQQYACGYIFTVILCANIVGLSHQIAQEIYHFQLKRKPISIGEIKISISIGVYLVITAGGTSLLAVASNILREHSSKECFVLEDSDHEQETSPLEISEENEQSLYDS